MAEFWSGYGLPLLIIVAQSLALIVILLIIVAFLLYADRKIWAAVQMRRGPNVVGPFGLLQSFADLLKFVFKEPIIPAGANKGLFLLAPVVMAGLALSAWAVMPVAKGWAIADINVGILYIFAISSLQVYGVIMAGWASNSKYAFLAALRSAAQMVSYEVSIGFVIITVLLCAGSLDLTKVVEAQDGPLGLFGWYWLPLLPMFVVIMFMGGIVFDGWHILWGILKYVLLLVIVVLIRNTSPRVRIDQAVRFFWGPVTGIAALAVILAFAGI